MSSCTRRFIRSHSLESEQWHTTPVPIFDIIESHRDRANLAQELTVASVTAKRLAQTALPLSHLYHLPSTRLSSRLTLLEKFYPKLRRIKPESDHSRSTLPSLDSDIPGISMMELTDVVPLSGSGTSSGTHEVTSFAFKRGVGRQTCGSETTTPRLPQLGAPVPPTSRLPQLGAPFLGSL